MQLSREQVILVIGATLVIMIGFGTFIYRHVFATAPPEELLYKPLAIKASSHRKILIHIVGAIKNEGVYKINLGDRLVDVIELAGGAKRNADLSSLNLAEEVKDGQKIKVPTRQPRHTGHSRQIGQTGEVGQKGQIGKVNLNTATLKELTSLKGIGKATAERIVEYRIKNGPFTKPEDITKVSRIGKKTYERLKNRLTI